MSDRYLPTDQERTKIDRITSWRHGLMIAGFIPLLLIGVDRLIPEHASWLSVALAVAGVAVLLGVLIYASFFLRCPRCASWVGVVVPKCASCGLKFEATKRSSIASGSR